MTDVRYTNYNREFVGIAYKKTDDAYTYAEISKANNVRTLADVALRAKNGESYKSLEQGQQKIIDDYVTYSSVKSTVAIDENFASGDVSNWNVKEIESDNYLNINASVESTPIITTESYTNITEISYDLRLNANTTTPWVGISTNSTSVYKTWVLCRTNGFGEYNATVSNFTQLPLNNNWITVKYASITENSFTLYAATKGQQLKKIGDFTAKDENVKAFNAGQICFSVAGTNLDFDIDNFTVTHSGGTTTENFNKSDEITDTIFTKKSGTINICKHSNLAYNDKYYVFKSGTTANSFIRTRSNYNSIKSYSYDIRVGSGTQWIGISLHSTSQYRMPFYIYADKIQKTDYSTLYAADGNEQSTISIDFTEWKTLKIVPTGITEDGGEQADVYVGKPGKTLTKVASFKVSQNKLTDCPVSKGCPTITTSGTELYIDTFTLTYEENGEDKTITETFADDYKGIDSEGRLLYDNVFINPTNDNKGKISCETHDAYTDNLIAKTAISGGEGMTDNDAIVYTTRVNYICGNGKFNITLNYADNNYNEYIAIENGKATYYVGETAGSSVDFTAETGAEITLEIKVYKSGAISLRVNDADNAVTLRTSGTTGTFAIFAVSGTTKITSIKAISYSIPTNA